ncbi:TetR family transcriptional regulator [Paramixta manurensis]|uniref:TetR family transcriptional regulator n=2 Tax=Paramixta manurensis TaxID=2740817 RepID=A0A6M8UJJ9_9GAMM|nr:TetR family transcriptional regulator [Erwiniaceae bacterium PD-1]
MVQRDTLQNMSLTSTRARTRQLLIETAMQMFDSGAFPSITEVAHAAQLSRATAYRYFPTQSALVSAVVAETLSPMRHFQPTRQEATERIDELLTFAFPKMLQHEGTLRAALHLSLTQWAQSQSEETVLVKEKLVRGNRKNLLQTVAEPLVDELPPELFQRVIHALSVVYGSEIFLVMKDIWGCDNQTLQDVAKWMAKAIVRQAREDAQKPPVAG